MRNDPISLSENATIPGCKGMARGNGCHLVLKPGAEGYAQKSGRVVIFLDDCMAVFIFQAKLSSDFHSPQNSDADHRGKAVYDTAEDGERTVVTNTVGDGPLFIKPETQPFVPAAYGK